MPQWRSVSPSQISDFRRCPRKWYYRNLMGIKQPQTENQRKGEDIHKVLECYYLGVEPPKEVRWAIPVAQNLLKILPERGEPKPEVQINGALTLAGVPVNGRLDLVSLKRLAVWDYKTISSISKYAKSEEELKEDPQAIAYLLWLYTRTTSGAEQYQFAHTYLEPKTGRTLFVGVRFTAAELLHAQDTLAGTVANMKWSAGQPKVELLEANTSACNDFGGCYYRGMCAGGNWRSQMGLLSDTPDVKPETKPESESKSAQQTLPIAQTSAQPKPEPAAALPAGAIQAENAKKGLRYDIGNGKVGTCKGPAGANIMFAGPDRVYQVLRTHPVIQLSSDDAIPAVPTQATEKPRHEMTTETPKDPPAPRTSAAEAITLYLYCRPLRVEMFDMTILSEFDAFCQELGGDPRLMDNGPMAFGKWRVHFGKRIAAKLSAIQNRELAIITRGDVVNAALEAILPHVSKVVMG